MQMCFKDAVYFFFICMQKKTTFLKLFYSYSTFQSVKQVRSQIKRYVYLIKLYQFKCSIHFQESTCYPVLITVYDNTYNSNIAINNGKYFIIINECSYCRYKLNLRYHRE